MAWTHEAYDLRNIVGMDGNANWLLGVKRDEFLAFGEDTLVPFLMISDPGGLTDLLDAAFRTIRDDDDLKDVRLFHFEIEGEAERMDLGGVTPLLGNLEFFIKFSEKSGKLEDLRAANKQIILSSPSPMFNGVTGNLILPNPEFLNVSAADAVITAVIDDGIAYAHERFRDNTGGTRIQYAWDHAKPFGTGFLTKAEIEADFATKDEDQIYRDLGLVDHREPHHKTAAWRRAHGTHVLDLAAGFPPADDRTDRPILAVNLHPIVLANTSGQLLDFNLFFAGVFIALWANALFAAGVTERPVVINASLGYTAGPHDGNSAIDVYIAVIGLLAAKGVKFIVPAGNAHLSRCHAKFLVSPTPVAFDWMVLPNDLTDSYFEAWLPTEATTERVKLTITTPDGVAHTIRDIAGDSAILMDSTGTEVGLAEVTQAGTDRLRICVHIKPTDRFRPSPFATAPAGRWQLEFVKDMNAMADPVHVWIQRDDSIYGYPRRGRQSYFVHPDYIRFDIQGREIRDDHHLEQVVKPDCPVKRKSLLNAIGTGPDTFTAGGYIRRNCDAARYSAGGPNVPAEGSDFRKPDLLMVSEDSLALPGVLAAGSRSGSVVWMNGTSVAAPQLARRIADLVAAGIDVTRDTIKAEAQNKDLCPTPSTETDRRGWGRLERSDLRRVPRS